MTNDAQNKGSMVDYFTRALTLYGDNFLALVNLAFASAAPMILKSLLDIADETGASLVGVIFSPLVFCVNTFFLMCLTYMISSIASGQQVVVRDVMAHVWARLLKGLGGYLLLTAGAFAGLLLLVLPGIYFVTAFNFFVFAILLEDAGVIDSFKRSAALVHPRFWRVLGANGLVLLLTALLFIPLMAGMSMMQWPVMVIAVITGVAGALLMPVFVGFYYFIFDELKTACDGPAVPAVKS